MKKIYLLCSQGMSTSILASMMQDCANKHKLPVEIVAYPHGKLPSVIEKRALPDAILLGPQVFVRRNKTKIQSFKYSYYNDFTRRIWNVKQ